VALFFRPVHKSKNESFYLHPVPPKLYKQLKIMAEGQVENGDRIAVEPITIYASEIRADIGKLSACIKRLVLVVANFARKIRIMQDI
jgi:hypothetical protein